MFGGCGFNYTSDQLASCLERMPRLQLLSLSDCTALHSLSFLYVGTLAATLTSLELNGDVRSIPLAELHKVHALQSLRSLRLSLHVFDAEFNQFMRLYTPPSRILPTLQSFVLIKFSYR